MLKRKRIHHKLTLKPKLKISLPMTRSSMKLLTMTQYIQKIQLTGLRSDLIH